MRSSSAVGHQLAWFLAASSPSLALSQTLESLVPEVRRYVTVDQPTVVLTHVQLVDGTGGQVRPDQTIVISGGKITAVGPASSTTVPKGGTIAVLDLTGHTVFPGMIGLHNHTFYYTATPRAAQANYTAPRLYLGAGITTIRTTGSASPYAELNLKANIERGEIPGPRLFVAGPYLISPGPDMRLDYLGMHEVSSPEMARKVVDYWAEEGATWLKVYNQLHRSTLAAITEQAHKRGLKVTGHLCSVGFREAIAAGIDALEHGLLTNSEYVPGKKPDLCPTGIRDHYAKLDIRGDPRVRATIDEMVAKKIAMTSTLTVYEAGTPGRPWGQDHRLWDVLSPDARVEEEARHRQVEGSPGPELAKAALARAMEFEVAFFRAGGLLGAGVDPAWSVPAGIGDQRNYELLIEAGLSPSEAVQVMSLNGARILGIDDRLGSVAVGKVADLVVIAGDPVARPVEIRKVSLVFRDGIGYDPVKLFASAKGLVGIR
jgi:imidazolonepropionase-like amidohydrolase